MFLTKLTTVAAVALAILGTCPSAAQDGGPPQNKTTDEAALHAVLKKAIDASGGEDKLNQLKALTCKAKGVVVFGDSDLAVSFTASLQGLDQCRLDVEKAIVVVHNRKLKGLDGWFDSGNDVARGSTQIPGAGFDQGLYAMRLAQLLVPLQSKEFRMSPIGEINIGQRPAVGITFSHKDNPDLALYFDKETSLPVKGQMPVSIKVNGNLQTVSDEFTFAEYKDREGLRHFTKLTFEREGKKRLDVELSDLAPQEKLDDQMFEKP